MSLAIHLNLDKVVVGTVCHQGNSHFARSNSQRTYAQGPLENSVRLAQKQSIYYKAAICRGPLDVVKPHFVPTKAHRSWRWSAGGLFQFIQMLQPRQDDLLASLFNLAGKKDLVEDGVDLVKVEDEVELADVAEEGVEDLDKEVDGLEVGELVVVGVNAGAEEKARVPAVDDLVVAELDEVGLVFLVARGHETVDLEVE